MNISELAQHLDVAVSTVSRVLSGNAEKYRISQKTEKRIREAAEKFHVVPDPLGAGLRRGKIGMVGLLVPDITNPFFSHLARAVESKLRNRGIAVQLCDSNEDPETELDLLRNLMSRRLDGLIVAPVGVSGEQLASTLRRSPFPTILLDRILTGVDAPTIAIDNRAAGSLAANCLLELGHTSIGCLRGNPLSRSDRDRLAGVEDALQRKGDASPDLLVSGEGYSAEQSRAAAEALLQRDDRPSAIITLSGQGILGTLEVAREFGISLPDELSLVAFDEQPWSSLVHPPLTTISQPIEKMAEKAAEILSSQLDGETSAQSAGSHIFEATLIKRSSVTIPC